MRYKDFVSKNDDSFWLINQIRNKLGDKIIINKLKCNEGILDAGYLLKGYENGIDFHISYSKEEFIRVVLELLVLGLSMKIKCLF